jgi:hypothetical protein
MEIKMCDEYSNTFTKEPDFNCPVCGVKLFTDWVDNGFGTYSIQASPYICECGWHEIGCKTCCESRCFSWEKCQGKALNQQSKIEELSRQIEVAIVSPELHVTRCDYCHKYFESEVMHADICPECRKGSK